MPIPRILALLTSNPAQLIQQKDRGTLKIGSHADLVLFHPTGQWTFATSKSKSKNSPFNDWTLPGQIHLTISEGRIVHRI